MFKIVWSPQAEPVGIIGFWEKTWRGELVCEAGWFVLPEYQGRGIAVAATEALIRLCAAGKGTSSPVRVPVRV